MDEALVKHLQDLLRTHRPELLPAVVEQKCPTEYSWFVEQLAKASPVVALVPLDSAEFLRLLLEKELTADEARVLARTSPFTFRVFSEGSHSVCWVKRCLQVMLQKIELLDITNPHLTDDDNGAIGFFPHVPSCRARGRYRLDRNPTEPLCSKNAPGHGTLLPGLFTLHCQHSKSSSFCINCI